MTYSWAEFYLLKDLLWGYDPVFLCGSAAVFVTILCWIFQWRFSPFASEAAPASMISPPCCKMAPAGRRNNETASGVSYEAASITEKEVHKLVESPQYQAWFLRRREMLYTSEIWAQWRSVLGSLLLVLLALWGLSCPSFFTLDSLAVSGEAEICSLGFRTSPHHQLRQGELGDNKKAESYHSMLLKMYEDAASSLAQSHHHHHDGISFVGLFSVILPYALSLASLAAFFITLSSVSVLDRNVDAMKTAMLGNHHYKQTTVVSRSTGCEKNSAQNDGGAVGVYASEKPATRALCALLPIVPCLKLRQERVVYVAGATLVTSLVGILYAVCTEIGIGYGFVVILVVALVKCLTL